MPQQLVHVSTLIVLLAPALALATDGGANATRWESLALSAAHWKQVNWERLPDDPLVRDLPPVNDPNEGAYVKRKGSGEFCGTKLSASLLTRPAGASQVHMFSLDSMHQSEFGLSDCREITRVISASLGTPATNNEIGRSGDVIVAAGAVDAEWVIGDSRVTTQCNGVDFAGGRKVGMFFLTASHRDARPALKPFVWINCAREAEVIDGEKRARRDVPDTIFVIDESGATLYTETFGTIGKSEITAEAIVTDVKNDSKTSKITINRATGQYYEDATTKDNTRVVLTGRCRRIERPQKLF
jgi:hypothetical protein